MLDSIIKKKGYAGVKDISEIMGLNSSNVTGMFKRMAKAVTSVDKRYGGEVKKTEEEFYRMMAGLEFLPNTPTLMNAGTDLGQLSACFVLPMEDSLKSIFGALTKMSLIHQSGGGTGFSFSRLRPRGHCKV